MKKKCNGLIRKGSYSKKKCAYCGIELYDDFTRDHVPPRFIFKCRDDAISENWIAIPCCYKCNQYSSVIEQRLMDLCAHIDETANRDLIVQNNKSGEFNLLMGKIAFGYRSHETNKYLNTINPKVKYFLRNEIEDSNIRTFLKIRHDGVIDDLSSNAGSSGLLFYLDNIILASSRTDLSSVFWHEYNVNYDFVRMPFYDTLYVQIQF